MREFNENILCIFVTMQLKTMQEYEDPMNFNLPEISVVISVFNEEDNVVPLTEKIDEALSAYEYEIIYADDGSSDQTIERINALNNPRVVLVELQRNYGQSYALAAGIDQARGAYIVTMDGDLQNDPIDIPHMLEMAKEKDLDMVAGIRKNRKDNFVRTIPSKIANAIIKRSTGVYIIDNGCALKVFKNNIAKDIGLYGEMHRFIGILAVMDGARIEQVPVNHHPRIYGKSKYGLQRTFKVISDLMLMMFFKKYQKKPMHLFGTLGFFATGLGVLINIYLLILKILGQDIWGKPMLILGVILLLGGIQFITIGIILEFLMRTYYESQQKKPYKVRKVHMANSQEA